MLASLGVIYVGDLLLEMGDNRQGRDKQAHDAERRQQEREIAEAIERMEEPEPTVDSAELDVFTERLETVAFPASGTAVVSAVGDETIEADDGTYTIAELVPETDTERFDSPTQVRERIQRPTVATAMKAIVEESDAHAHVDLRRSQKLAYEKTFRALAAIEADDDDEGIQVIADWVIEQMRENEKLPGSRGVRRQAAKYCRTNGYQVRDDEWLGV